MRDVHSGWLVRYLHANTASAFFTLVYLHIARGMYYGCVAILVVLRELCPKLSNSGKTLKLMVPNSCSSASLILESYYSSWVISRKIQETVVGYRGSKSCFDNFIDHVKEQRVYGSLCFWCIM